MGGEDGFGLGYPCEGIWVLVAMLNPFVDRVFKFCDITEDASSDALARDLSAEDSGFAVRDTHKEGWSFLTPSSGQCAPHKTNSNKTGVFLKYCGDVEAAQTRRLDS